MPPREVLLSRSAVNHFSKSSLITELASHSKQPQKARVALTYHRFVLDAKNEMASTQRVEPTEDKVLAKVKIVLDQSQTEGTEY